VGVSSADPRSREGFAPAASTATHPRAFHYKISTAHAQELQDSSRRPARNQGHAVLDPQHSAPRYQRSLALRLLSSEASSRTPAFSPAGGEPAL